MRECYKYRIAGISIINDITTKFVCNYNKTCTLMLRKLIRGQFHYNDKIYKAIHTIMQYNHTLRVTIVCINNVVSHCTTGPAVTIIDRNGIKLLELWMTYGLLHRHNAPALYYIRYDYVHTRYMVRGKYFRKYDLPTCVTHFKDSGLKRKWQFIKELQDGQKIYYRARGAPNYIKWGHNNKICEMCWYSRKGIGNRPPNVISAEILPSVIRYSLKGHVELIVYYANNQVHRDITEGPAVISLYDRGEVLEREYFLCGRSVNAP